VAEWQTAIAGRDDFKEVARIALAGPGQAEFARLVRGQTPAVGASSSCHQFKRFGYFHQIALVPEGDLFEDVGATIEDEVDQAADVAHASGEQQMQGLLAEPELFAMRSSSAPMPLEKSRAVATICCILFGQVGTS